MEHINQINLSKKPMYTFRTFSLSLILLCSALHIDAHPPKGTTRKTHKEKAPQPSAASLLATALSIHSTSQPGANCANDSMLTMIHSAFEGLAVQSATDQKNHQQKKQ